MQLDVREMLPVEQLGQKFEIILQANGLYAALALLNGTTTHRLTGIYTFQPGLVANLILFDRDDPGRQHGDDVPWFDSYCMMTAQNGTQCEIQDSLTDARLVGHAARRTVMSYCAVLLRTFDGEPLGTLCHYDFSAKETIQGTFDRLHACRPAVERHLAAGASIATS